jgi:hypothetical protein
MLNLDEIEFTETNIGQLTVDYYQAGASQEEIQQLLDAWVAWYHKNIKAPYQPTKADLAHAAAFKAELDAMGATYEDVK